MDITTAIENKNNYIFSSLFLIVTAEDTTT
jgi:hypothetical protein